MLVCTIGLVAMAELMAVTLRVQQPGAIRQRRAARADKIDELTTRDFVTSPAAACGGSITTLANHFDMPMEDRDARQSR
jgi:hypothetical protein